MWLELFIVGRIMARGRGLETHDIAIGVIIKMSCRNHSYRYQPTVVSGKRVKIELALLSVLRNSRIICTGASEE